ncbi:AAA family ATPase [Pantoea agglomerans]
MLERIQKITGIGLFADTKPAAFPFRKLSLIYADNGRGKSTLAALLKSCGDNQPQLLINRRTIGLSTPQHAELLFSQGNRSAFTAGQWSAQYHGTHVYDLNFVESSVYSGGEINATHRKQLLSFALGENAVGAMKAFNDATDVAAEKTKRRKAAEEKLNPYRENATPAAYMRMKKITGAAEEIAIIEQQLRQADSIASIRTRKGYDSFARFRPDLAGLLAIMNATHQELSSQAEDAVRAHVNNIESAAFKSWAHSGLNFIKNETCPFCTQSLKGIALIGYYRECFDEAFSRLNTQVATLDDLKGRVMGTLNLPLLQSRIEQANSITSLWAGELDLKVALPNMEQIKASYEELDALLALLIAQKKTSPLTAPDKMSADRCTALLDAINDPLDGFNVSVTIANSQIAEFREQLEQLPVVELRARLKELNERQKRFSPEVVALVESCEQAKTAEKLALEEKEARREDLNAIMRNTLGRYEHTINKLLTDFGARFSIREIRYNYSGGGEPKSEYAIELRGEKLALSGEVSSFKTSLSEGDKRTLAFAFFIAVVVSDPGLKNKIVVIDDPMCSLDKHRRTQTLSVLKKVYDGSRQLIVMAHDMYFLKSLLDEFDKKKESQNVACMRIVHAQGDHSHFATLDVDRECESAYYSNHRLVSGYLAGENYVAREVATAIRPLLEGYLHRRYPGHVAPGLLFGEIVRKIAGAGSDSPLYHAATLVDELNEINTYAGKFHHDTNAAAGAENVEPGELLAYSRRALSVIYGGQVA